MEFLAYFRAIRRHWFVIGVCVVVGAGLGVASTQLESDKVGPARTYHKATHTLFFDGSANSGAFSSAFTNLDQMAVLTTTGPVPEAVADELGTTETGRQLAEKIITLTNATTSTLEITAIDRDMGTAEELADTFAATLVAELTAKDVERYNRANESAKARVDDLDRQIDALTVQIAAQPPNVDVVKAQLLSVSNRYQQAYSDFQEIASTEPPTSALSTLEAAESIPIGEAEYDARLALGQLGTNNLQAGNPNAAVVTGSSSSSSSFDGPVSRGVLGGLLGLLAGVGIALLMERVDRRIRSRESAETAYGLPVLAEVPESAEKDQRDFVVAAYDAPMSAAAEAYRAIRSALLFQHAAGAVASDGDPGGNGAKASGSFEPGHAEPMVVMVVSAAPKEGKTTTTANLSAVFAEAGSTVLVVNCDFRRPMVHRYLDIEDMPRRVSTTRIPGVKAVTNVLDDPGSNPARVIAEQRRLLEAARGQFDVMIIDTAPLLSTNDAVELVGGVDLVLFVARGGVSTTHAAARVVEQMVRVHAPVAGVVLIGAGEHSNNYYYNYYLHTDTPAADRGRRRRRRKAARAERNEWAPVTQAPEGMVESALNADEPPVS